MTTFDRTTTISTLHQEIRASLLDARSAEAKAGRALVELRKRIEAKGVDWWPWFASIFEVRCVQAARDQGGVGQDGDGRAGRYLPSPSGAPAVSAAPVPLRTF